MFNIFLPCILLLACNTASSQQVDFEVQFEGPQHQIPPGLVYGLNDLQHTSQGVWNTWSNAVQPHDAVVRIWVQRYLGTFNKGHIAAAKRAQKAGLGVMLTVVGVTGDKHDRRPDEARRDIIVPPDNEKWAKEFAKDVRAMIAAGVDVRYVEIWNEPDMPYQWGGSQEDFGDFFAQTGIALRKELDNSISIGGPGMASGGTPGLSYFEVILDSCKKYKFKPDFLSWHHYSSFATDNEFLDTAGRIHEMCAKRRLGKPELILSEWNVSLPRPIAIGMDTNVGAAFWSSMVSSLIQTPTTHALYFFLQDGSWEADDDFAQQSVGAFTLRGAPKATFSAMKLMAEVTKFSAVPLQRVDAINNLTCVATRNKDTGHLLLTNANGDILRVARKYLAILGMEMSDLRGKDRLVKSYFLGAKQFSQLGLAGEWQVPLSKTKGLIEKLKKEESDPDRWVRIHLDSVPKSILRVRLIDETHGNPIASASFREMFKPYEGGFGRAVLKSSLEELAKQGVSKSERDALQRAYESGQRDKQVAGVSAATLASSRAVFLRLLEKLSFELPAQLAAHPACSAADMAAKDWVKISGDTLLVKLPQHSIVAVELEL
ncbi:MAG: hypothetical protein H8E25_07180 [Planctomycetes bacterium]|nr:hypothetical protein [Planctomycetota bacterium]